MGFYDDFRNIKNKRLTLFLITTATVLGGLIVALILPYLFNHNFTNHRPILIDPSDAYHTTSVKVSSQVSTSVQQLSPAVVSVFNSQGTGSGIIFAKTKDKTEKAYVVTNYHVLGNSTWHRVVLPEGKGIVIDAKLRGYDKVTDLAVLEIPGQNVKNIAPFGNSDTILPGEPVFAIGNPLDLGQSVTAGVISSPKKSIDISPNMGTDVIQTDTAINPGNSGGPLANLAGQVIGINTIKISETGIEGINFAIPINEARPILNQLVQIGRVNRPYLGVSLSDLPRLPHWNLQIPPSIEGGVVIKNVGLGTPAQKAGLKAKDIIVSLDNTQVLTTSELRRYLFRNKKIGETVKITYYRSGSKKETKATLAKAP